MVVSDADHFVKLLWSHVMMSPLVAFVVTMHAANPKPIRFMPDVGELLAAASRVAHGREGHQVNLLNLLRNTERRPAIATRATHTHLASDKGHTRHKHSYTRRPAEPGGSAYGVGVVGWSSEGRSRRSRLRRGAGSTVASSEGTSIISPAACHTPRRQHQPFFWAKARSKRRNGLQALRGSHFTL